MVTSAIVSRHLSDKERLEKEPDALSVQNYMNLVGTHYAESSSPRSLVVAMIRFRHLSGDRRTLCIALSTIDAVSG